MACRASLYVNQTKKRADVDAHFLTADCHRAAVAPCRSAMSLGDYTMRSLLADWTGVRTPYGDSKAAGLLGTAAFLRGILRGRGGRQIPAGLARLKQVDTVHVDEHRNLLSFLQT
ncbi:hypothetical protein RAS2_34480 [Phycisphaerae bacterium RAS2]|nr:hypothetical protein RAS2_34480 [Phycisphaerae bacterium RAS2]